MSKLKIEQDKELRGIVGEMPNYIFECLELSDEIKEEWKHGSKASDFGSHNQFVQRFSKRIEALITADRKRVELEARVDEIEHIAGFTNGMTNQMFKNLQNRIAELTALKEQEKQ